MSRMSQIRLRIRANKVGFDESPTFAFVDPLPPACISCGLPTAHMWKRMYPYFQHPGFFLTLPWCPDCMLIRGRADRVRGRGCVLLLLALAGLCSLCWIQQSWLLLLIVCLSLCAIGIGSFCLWRSWLGTNPGMILNIDNNMMTIEVCTEFRDLFEAMLEN
jgi:hypothetical protein